MQDDCLDVSNQPFYKRQKKLITTTVGASRASKITLMLTWRLNYGSAVITSITVLSRVATLYGQVFLRTLLKRLQ